MLVIIYPVFSMNFVLLAKTLLNPALFIYDKYCFNIAHHCHVANNARDAFMKSFFFIFTLATTIPLTGCQSFQFVESPIPVKTVSSKMVSSKTLIVEDLSNASRPANAILTQIP
ncbi:MULTISPECIES: hypothetical protein [unclassified Psychrobacter]|uniref:hypothetical protein n=1 Tax=unclassified Psychrobacter TaxID=196806 RepID=UPI0025D3A231|nr:MULTISPECIES: hypothetical protein [unclassified Psychrobacter]